MSFDDPTRRPRPGEAPDAARLTAYLRTVRPDLEGPLEIRQFPAGHSNLTYLLRFGDEEFVLRRPPSGWKPASGHDMGREWTVLSALAGRFPYVPEPVAFCDDPEVLGAPFFVMRRIRGLILRRELPDGLHVDPAMMRRLCERLVDVHLELHALDYRELGLETFGRPDGYVERQISGWSRRYRRVRTPDVPDFERIMAWLEASRPPERGAVIVHNDYRFDNVVFDPEDGMSIVGVLDWEMATVGDPLMDLGASLAYWIEPDDPDDLRAIRLGPTTVPGALKRREVIERYLDGSGLRPGDFRFYLVYGLFRLAVIAQQIAYRARRSRDADPRFRHLGDAVRALERAAHRAMETGDFA